MRILTVSAFFESHGGGIEIVAGSLAKAFAVQGHDSSWAAAALDPLPEGPLPYIPLAASDPIEKLSGLPMPIPSLRAMRTLWRAVGTSDGVVVHDALYLPSIVAALAARRHRKPWVLIQHIGKIPYRSLLLRGLMALANASVTRPLLRRATQAVFISDAVRKQFETVKLTRPAQLLFNGVDNAVFYPPRDTIGREVLAGELGLPVEHEVLLFVGRFVEKKGMAALRELAVRRPQSQIVMAGSGPIDPVAWTLPNVTVLGRCSRTRLAELYRAADALILLSIGEGYPLVIQEAMACGLPCYCGRDSAEADPGATQWLHEIDVDPFDPAKTAKRLVEALTADPPRRSEQAAAYARDTYNWERNATRLAAMLG